MSDTTPNEVFAKITLPNGTNAVVYEGYGRHFFNAMKACKGESCMVVKYLMLELLEVDGKLITEEALDALHIRDINYVSTVINMMMANDIPGLPGL
jgi:hypothetical protein